MTIDKSRDIAQIDAEREDAEKVLAEAKTAADALRAEHAAAALRQAFPQHTLAVFTRAWDEDGPKLYQLLSSQEGVDDIDLEEDGEKLTREQLVACSVADRAIRLIGSDDEIYEHLDLPDEEHQDWTEFDLSLVPETKD